ncbi:hypothetical protein D3C72_1529200 [compost metagenome]
MGRRQWVELDALSIRNCLLDVGIAARLQIRAKNGKATIRIGPNGPVAVGNGLFVIGWHDEVFATVALVRAGRTHVLERVLPRIVDTSGD